MDDCPLVEDATRPVSKPLWPEGLWAYLLVITITAAIVIGLMTLVAPYINTLYANVISIG